MTKKRLIEITQKLISNGDSKPNMNGRIYDKNSYKNSVQNYVKKMRSLKEEQERRRNLKTVYDQSREEDKMKKTFDDLNVTIDFIPLEVYEDYVFWGGTIDGIIQFAYKVSPEEKTSGVEFNYLEDFSVDNPDNDEIVKRVENYYDQFYQYWRDNIIEK